VHSPAGDVVQHRLIARSYRPLRVLFNGGWRLFWFVNVLSLIQFKRIFITDYTFSFFVFLPGFFRMTQCNNVGGACFFEYYCHFFQCFQFIFWKKIRFKWSVFSCNELFACISLRKFGGINIYFVIVDQIFKYALKIVGYRSHVNCFVSHSAKEKQLCLNIKKSAKNNSLFILVLKGDNLSEK